VAAVGLVFARSAPAQPNEARRAAQRARSFVVAGQCDLAVPSLDQALALDPGNPELLRDRGACHDRLGHRQAAVADYRAYCAAAPTGVDVAAVRQRIAQLEAGPSAPSPPVQAPTVAGPRDGYVPPVIAPSSLGEPEDSSVATVRRVPRTEHVVEGRASEERIGEDHIRFRGGVSVAAGFEKILIDSGPMVGVDGRFGVQLFDLVAVYVQPHLSLGSLSANGVSGLTGTFAVAGMAELTLVDRFFVGAGGGYGIFNSPSGPMFQARIGAYPLMDRGLDSVRRHGLMLGVDLRTVFIQGATGVMVMGAIGYEAF
jgi:hypothetical protein